MERIFFLFMVLFGAFYQDVIFKTFFFLLFGVLFMLWTKDCVVLWIIIMYSLGPFAV